MFMNNKFSTKNKQLYKMKCINTRSQEYKCIEDDYITKYDLYTDKAKKWKTISLFLFFCYNKDVIERRKKVYEVFMCKCW
jgi:hypothetical protein